MLLGKQDALRREVTKEVIVMEESLLFNTYVWK